MSFGMIYTIDFLEGVERLCVCMCVCMFEDEVDLEYE